MLVSINNVLDIADAYVRESSTCLDYLANAKYFRKFRVRGMPGSYRRGAQIINTAVDCMRQGIITPAGFLNRLTIKRQCNTRCSISMLKNVVAI